MTECHLCSVSPEWAPAELDPKSPELLLALVGLEAPPIEGSRRKVLRSLALLELRAEAGREVGFDLAASGPGSRRRSDGPASCPRLSC